MADCTSLQTDNTGKDFTDCDFSGKDFSGYIFKNCTLKGTNFSGCTFDSNTDFTNAIFGSSSATTATSFAGCDLTTAKFRVPAMFGGASGSRTALTNLSNTKLPWNLLGSTPSSVNITGATLSNLPADFSRLQFTSVKWNNYNFAGVSLSNSHFMNCDLTGCVMTKCILDYVSFIQVTDLTGVKMNNCSLNHTVFDGSTMTNTDLSYATKMTGCSFLNTLLKGTFFDGNDLTTSKFGIPDLTSTDPAYITSFQFATLTADFMITNLQKKWQCADFRNVIIKDFSTIINQLYNVQAHDSLFNNSLSFQNARLNGSNFNNATFNGVNFSNAFLNNVNLVGAKTVKGSKAGKRAAVFNVSQANTNLQAPNDYNSFLNSLNNSDLNAITSVFSHFGFTVGNISSTPTTDPVSKNQAWIIVDQQTLPNRTYMAVQSPILPGTQYELLVYDNSPAAFSYAFMIGSYMETIDFSNAKMDHTQLYGATITYSNLSFADFTGAQLGENGAVFSISQTDTSIQPPYDYASFLSALQTPALGKLVDLFQYYGYTVGNILCATTTVNGNAAWSITDQQQNPSKHYQVVQKPLQNNSGQYELDVFFTDAAPAKLDRSYMAGIILTQANLTACSAEGCHLYNDQMTSSGAVLNHTTLADVSFVNANLYKADFTSAVVDGADFTGANLMDANFKGVNFKSGTNGKAVAFNNTSLQGADFSSCTIQNAVFLSAAVCVRISDKPADAANTYGVWLRSTKNTDNNFTNYLSELNNASNLQAITNPTPSVMSDQFLTAEDTAGHIQQKLIPVLSKVGITVSISSTISILQYALTWKITDGTNIYLLIPGYDTSFTVAYNVYLSGNPVVKCSINYNTAFSAGTITQSLIDTLNANSAGNISLSNTAAVSNYQRPTVWTIVDPASINYTLWWGVQMVNSKLNNVTYVRSSLTFLTNFFSYFNIQLRPQSKVTKTTDTTANTTTWMVDMGKDDAYYLNTGYLQFKVVGNSATAPTKLDIYGYTMRMAGYGNNQQQVIQDFDCEVTKICCKNIDSTTLMPNNSTKQQNSDLKFPFNQWMQAYSPSPTPPACVPTEISYCQAPSLAESVQESVKQIKMRANMQVKKTVSVPA